MKRAEGTRLIGVCSRDRGRAEAFAEKHGISAAYDSLADLLKNPEVHAVFIASPNSLHALHTKMAAEAGKHILVEKPMSVERVRSLGDGARLPPEAGVNWGSGSIFATTRAISGARQLHRGRNLGTITLAQAQFLLPG